jgi:hypothetical protein
MKLLSAILAAATLGASSAFATVVQIPGFGQDMPKNGTGVGGGNGASPDDNFARLQSVLSGLGSSYPTPLSAGSLNISSNVVSGNQLLGFEYAVLHYGVGNGGVQGSGGGVAIFYITGGEANFTFPANGTGPNGFGGFSGGTLFNSNATPGNLPGPGVPGVPDGGTTATLLGSALIGLFLLRRRLV